MNLAKDKILREILKIYKTQRELANALRYSESQLSHALNKPSLKFLKKLETVGVNINNLIKGDNNQNTLGDNNILITTDKKELLEIILDQSKQIKELRQKLEDKHLTN